MMIYGAIEAGGTKFVCAVGTEELTILERVSFPTTTPVETMKQVIDFLNLLGTIGRHRGRLLWSN